MPKTIEKGDGFTPVRFGNALVTLIDDFVGRGFFASRAQAFAALVTAGLATIPPPGGNGENGETLLAYGTQLISVADRLRRTGEKTRERSGFMTGEPAEE